METRIKYVLVSGALALAIAALSVGSSAQPRAMTAHGCDRNGDCQAPLVCTWPAGTDSRTGGVCAQQCRENRDCQTGAHCVLVPVGQGFTVGSCELDQVNKRQLCGTDKMTCVFGQDCKSGRCTNGLCN
jgi:hypothetical protein